jgi:hypothetical protein
MAKSPVAILFTTDGVEVGVKHGIALPTDARGFLGVVYDGTNTLFARGDSIGRQVIVGAAAHGASVTGNPVLIGGSDGTNTYRFLTDTSGRVQVGTPQLPSTLVGGRLDGNIGAWFGSTAPTIGQKPMANSIPVTIATDQSPVPVTVGPSNAYSGLIVGMVKLGGGSANILQAIRATTYNEQTSDAQRSISSSSANDTSAGTGAQLVRITYYDSSCNGPFTETVTLSGTTAVATANTNICFIEEMRVTSTGSLGRNDGTLTLFVNASGGGGTIGTLGLGNVIAAQGDNRTLWSHHYIPPAKIASLATFVCSALVSGATAVSTFLLRSRNPTLATSPDVQVSEFLAQSAATVRQLGIPIKVVGPARITGYGIPAGNNQTLFASFDFSEL